MYLESQISKNNGVIKSCESKLRSFEKEELSRIEKILSLTSCISKTRSDLKHALKKELLSKEELVDAQDQLLAALTRKLEQLGEGMVRAGNQSELHMQVSDLPTGQEYGAGLARHSDPMTVEDRLAREFFKESSSLISRPNFKEIKSKWRGSHLFTTKRRMKPNGFSLSNLLSRHVAEPNKEAMPRLTPTAFNLPELTSSFAYSSMVSPGKRNPSYSLLTANKPLKERRFSVAQLAPPARLSAARGIDSLHTSAPETRTGAPKSSPSNTVTVLRSIQILPSIKNYRSDFPHITEVSSDKVRQSEESSALNFKKTTSSGRSKPWPEVKIIPADEHPQTHSADSSARASGPVNRALNGSQDGLPAPGPADRAHPTHEKAAIQGSPAAYLPQQQAGSPSMAGAATGERKAQGLEASPKPSEDAPRPNYSPPKTDRILDKRHTLLPNTVKTEVQEVIAQRPPTGEKNPLSPNRFQFQAHFANQTSDSEKDSIRVLLDAKATAVRPSLDKDRPKQQQGARTKAFFPILPESPGSAFRGRPPHTGPGNKPPAGLLQLPPAEPIDSENLQLSSETPPQASPARLATAGPKVKAPGFSSAQVIGLENPESERKLSLQKRSSLQALFKPPRDSSIGDTPRVYAGVSTLKPPAPTRNRVVQALGRIMSRDRQRLPSYSESQASLSGQTPDQRLPQKSFRGLQGGLEEGADRTPANGGKSPPSLERSERGEEPAPLPPRLELDVELMSYDYSQAADAEIGWEASPIEKKKTDRGYSSGGRPFNDLSKSLQSSGSSSYLRFVEVDD